MTAGELPTELDISGYNCPIPLLRTKKALAGMAPGQLLRVIASDPGSEIDFRVYAEQAGHALLEVRTEGKKFIFLMKKNGGSAVQIPS